jgi:hypothetical protein
MGMTQQHEARNGLDELLRNMPRGRHLALQFKAPRPTHPDSEPYRFSINDRQHGHLERLSRLHPRAVHYVFPAFNTVRRLASTAPNLASSSWLLLVHDVGRVTPTPSGRHTVELYERSRQVDIHSDPLRIHVRTVGEALDEVAIDGPGDQTLIRHEALALWLDELFAQEESGQAIGQRLRGFGTVCVP